MTAGSFGGQYERRLLRDFRKYNHIGCICESLGKLVSQIQTLPAIFMKDRFNKYQWLELAISEQVDRLNESYYFDKRDNEFFSIFITDYFLTDTSSTDEYSGNPYSATELQTLTERINRLEINDTSILSIPRLTLDERKQMMEAFLEIHSRLQNSNDLRKLVDTENGRTNLDFDKLLDSEGQEQWGQFKSDFIRQKVDTFCNLQNINFDTATLWTDKKMTSVNLGLDNKKEPPTLEKEKPWWKFW